jgi:hypothetical protein
MIKKTMALTLGLTMGLSVMTAQAQTTKPLFCVWDILGKSGDIYNLVVDQSLAMSKQGMPFDIRAYTDERVAVEDYRTGQCTPWWPLVFVCGHSTTSQARLTAWGLLW